MTISTTLSRYIGRQFLTWFLFLLMVLLAIILLLDAVELLRRAAGKPEATLGLVLKMSLLKLPETGQAVFPFVVLSAAMYTFWKLTRSQELVVARAVGVSAWQFLAPVLIAAFLIGVFKVGAINPAGAILISRFEQLENELLRGRANSLNISRSGLWLRQVNEGDQILIHAESVVAGQFELRDVIVFLYDGVDNYAGRIDAKAAELRQGHWEIRNAWLNGANRQPEFFPLYRIPTDLTLETIEESFASPETMSFWELPAFIRTLESTGFSAVRHRLHFQSLLAQPFLFGAMVLFGAAFSLRQTRRGGTMIMIAAGILTGFVVFVMTDLILALGLSETIPVTLAAWTPAGISLLMGAAALLHLEDG